MPAKNATLSRRKFLAGAAAAGGTTVLTGALPAMAQEKSLKSTFTILHTNDMHSNFVGMGPASDYTPYTLNDDKTRGGYARLATMIATRKKARENQGPVLIVDGGDFSMGTAFAAASREIGGELQVMARMGYDATTFGNHEFDLGPDGLGQAIAVASKAGRIPAVLSSNTDFSGSDPTLANLQRLSKAGLVRRYLVIERGGVRFGLLGVLGKEAQIYTSGGAVKFPDPVESAREVVKTLREIEKVDVVIALSHGGVEKGKDGRFTTGEDVRLPEAVPGIDVVIGAHSHTALLEPIMVNGRTPVVQTGLEGKNLGELVITIDGPKLTVDAYQLHPIDDTIAGDPVIGEQIDKLKQGVSAAVFASRGYGVDQPLAMTTQDLPNTFTDIAAGTILANLVTDSFRKATQADIGFTVNGMMRAPLMRGKTGVLTVYDVFAVAPLGAGVVDTTAGSAMVTGYFTGMDLKNILEFFLTDNPAHPGEYFPRASGMRFRYDKSRPALDVVTAIELGDIDRGYKAIDTTDKATRLYSLTCPLMVGVILVAIPKYSKGKLALVAKRKDGQPLTSRLDALDAPRENSGFLLAPRGTVDRNSVATGGEDGGIREVKEWQAIMDHLRSLPPKAKGELPVIPVDARAAEVRAIRAG
ncbi:bifunctional UDP-sugar hydrolase/5'-nucleotidase [Variovorax dokdonensis]|uniref:Bifunctional UDP-sugar hydrolase/5'-nucleotidase n=1 Tax=Variovorax dokdonensis TaxID=344883 RepID=A0ABT7N5B7_9BURK|nr:bifunctional UDP-sugar hydrolase/5'-nucleotidase [Variovorax dokdonensis]MDM0043070.1 bifunctional UDP-sugar hydrolase/5'-nucleotidase [Variovorax dokdonensis]